MKPDVKAFFDEATYTVSYVVADPDTKKCIIIDPVLDYDPKSGRTSTALADQIIEWVSSCALEVEWILETHVHADHLTSAPYLKEKLGGRTGIGDRIPVIQKTFSTIFNTEREFHCDGRQFDHLFADGETFKLGRIEAKVIYTPGHTPACISFLIGDALFVGDTLFMPDYGTARADFPGGDAPTLYKSIQRLLTLPDETRMFMCHDYKAPGRDTYAWETSVAEQRASNIHVNATISEDGFVKMRTERDAGLDMPVLILPSVQINMRAGEFPPKEDNNTSYLKIPLNML